MPSPENKRITRHTTVTSIVALIALVCLVFVNEGVSSVLTRVLERSISDRCSSCQVTIRKLVISVFPLKVVLEDVSFEGGIKGDSYVTASLPRIDVLVRATSLFSGPIHVESIQIDRPEVTLLEGNMESEPLSSSARSAQDESQVGHVTAATMDRPIDCQQLTIKDGVFKYSRQHQDRKPDRLGEINVRQINLQTGRWGTDESLRDLTTSIQITATLEQSGKVMLSVDLVPQSPKPHLDLRLQLIDQKLSELNGYFDVHDGIALDGLLVNGDAQVSLRGSSLKAAVRAAYVGLDVKFRRMKDRGPTETFFSNILSTVKLTPSTHRLNASQEARQKKAIALRHYSTLERQPRESVVSLILRGMKVAALGVATR